MKTAPKEAIRMIANGSDFYFRFKTIDVIRNGQLLKKLTDSNCEDSSTTFRKGGPFGGIITKLDFAEEGMEAIQEEGTFRGMDSGFDLYLLDRTMDMDFQLGSYTCYSVQRQCWRHQQVCHRGGR